VTSIATVLLSSTSGVIITGAEAVELSPNLPSLASAAGGTTTMLFFEGSNANSGSFSLSSGGTNWGTLPPTAGGWSIASGDTFLTIECYPTSNFTAPYSFDAATAQNIFSSVVGITVTDAIVPSAPTLTAPANASYQDLSGTTTFDWTYNNTDGSTEAGYQLRIKISGAGSYSYYNASTSALQSSAITNASTSTSVTLPSGILANANTYNWSVASYSSYGLLGPFASDFTLVGQAVPVVGMTGPSGTITNDTTSVTWAPVFPSGASQTAYQIWVYAQSTTQQSGFAVGQATGLVWGSGVVNSSAVSAITGVLPNGQTLVFYLQLTETGNELSGIVSTTATVSFTPPAVPLITATATTMATGLPVISLDVTGQDNLLSTDDASFEGGIGTWFGVNATLAQGTTGVTQGSYALEVTVTAAGAASAQSAGYPVIPGNSYTTIGMWTAATGASAINYNLVWLDSSGATISQASGATIAPTGSAVQLSTAGVAPSNAATARPQLYIDWGSGPLPAPSAPTIAPQGTAGTTTYNYEITAKNSLGQTTASAVGTTTTGNATLSSTNYNLITWPAVALPAGSPGNLIYDSNLDNAIAAVGATWFPQPGYVAPIGTAAGDMNVLNPGTNSAEWVFYGNGVATTYVQESQPVTVVPGEEYCFSTSVNASAVTAGTASIQLYPNTEPSSNYLVVDQANGTNGGISGTVVVPAGVTVVYPVVSMVGVVVATGSTLTFSQIQLTQTSTAQTYEPGPLPTYPVYRDVSGTYEYIGSTTALGFEDTGQAPTSQTPPSTNTTGEIHSLDAAGIFPWVTDNLIYDSDLSEAIAATNPTWALNAIIAGTADGEISVSSPGTDSAEWVAYGNGATAVNAATVSEYFPVTPGSTYTLSAVVDASNVTGGNVGVSLGATRFGAHTAPVEQVNGVKGLIDVTYLVPSGTTELCVQVLLNSALAAAGSTITWSQIQLTQTSAVQPYQPGPLWTPGGFVGLQTVSILRSDGLYVRGASQLNPATPNALTQAITIVDAEAIPGDPYTYTAVMTVPLGNSSLTSLTSGPTASQTIMSTSWWEVDPTDLTTAINAQPTDWSPVNTEQSTAHMVTGTQVLNMVADTMLHQDFSGTFEIFNDAVYVAFQVLLKSQKTVYISSPWGDTDSGYFRVGPQSGGLSTGMGNKTKNTKLLPSTYGAGHRTVQITAVAQLRPGV
jgi:hypothetical protein